MRPRSLQGLARREYGRESRIEFSGEGLHVKYKLKVNGQTRTLEAPEDMPLLWALRDGLDLKGTKFGCGIAQCGACTVLVDGEARRSCITPVSSVGQSSITTIEGLSKDGSHPLQRAWEEIDVPQCGYCQAGQIMSAASLLAKTLNPTDGDIDAAMAGNICRCATYLRIRRAIHRAAELGKTTASAATGSGK
jgi:isoquinoline 1-oxidoreductase alpha subunit